MYYWYAPPWNGLLNNNGGFLSKLIQHNVGRRFYWQKILHLSRIFFTEPLNMTDNIKLPTLHKDTADIMYINIMNLYSVDV